jgi:FAD/FMN-containing dehydrogenase
VSYTHIGDSRALARDITLIERIGDPIAKEHRESSYEELFHVPPVEEAADDSERHYSDYTRCFLAGCELRSLSDPAFAEIYRELGRMMLAAPTSVGARQYIEIGSKRYGPSREPIPASAFNRRDGYGFLLQCYYDDPTHDELHREFATSGVQRVVDAGVTLGGPGVTIPNWISVLNEATVREIFGDKYERLQRVKAKYDPDNVFHRGLGIKPAT